MAAPAFVVAFAHKGENESGTARDMATHLRNLLNTALKATPRRFANNISVSVAPGGVIFALTDSYPDRRWNSVRQWLDCLSTRQAPSTSCLPCMRLLRMACCVPTCWDSRPTSKAGRPLRQPVSWQVFPGVLAVEESAWEFTILREQCGDARPLRGKSTMPKSFVCVSISVFTSPSLLQNPLLLSQSPCKSLYKEASLAK